MAKRIIEKTTAEKCQDEIVQAIEKQTMFSIEIAVIEAIRITKKHFCLRFAGHILEDMIMFAIEKEKESRL
jgi:hypothetical protein